LHFISPYLATRPLINPKKELNACAGDASEKLD
jgi:hypothetical protein